MMNYNRSGPTLHGHLAEMSKSMKNGMRAVSHIPGLTKPSIGEINELQIAGSPSYISNTNYYETLTTEIRSDSKRYNPKSWWDINVVRLLCELVIISQHATGMSTNQTATTIVDKAVRARQIQ